MNLPCVGDIHWLARRGRRGVAGNCGLRCHLRASNLGRCSRSAAVSPVCSTSCVPVARPLPMPRRSCWGWRRPTTFMILRKSSACPSTIRCPRSRYGWPWPGSPTPPRLPGVLGPPVARSRPARRSARSSSGQSRGSRRRGCHHLSSRLSCRARRYGVDPPACRFCHAVGYRSSSSSAAPVNSHRCGSPASFSDDGHGIPAQ